MAEYTNPKLPEGINVSDEHPLKDFFHLSLVTGLTLAAAFVLLILLSDVLVRFIPIRDEAALADRLPQLLESAGTSKADDPQTRDARDKTQAYLQQLASRIATQMALPQELAPTLHYVDADTVNAFATLNGQVYIFRGLLEQVHSENALAFVIAHELGHLKLRHPIKALGRGMVVMVALASIAGISETSLPDWLVNGSGQATLLSFSRGMELDADAEAMDALLASYGHLEGATELFDYLQRQDGVKVPALLSTHPAPDSRIQAITARQAQLATTSPPHPETVPLNDTPPFCLNDTLCLPLPQIVKERP